MKTSDQRSVELAGPDQYHVHALLGLPQKIMKNQQLHGLAQLVLHEFSRPDVFQFKKAVYLADNPDFDHLIGVAGFSSDESDLNDIDVWNNPTDAIEKMDKSPFNRSVRAFLRNSIKARDIHFDNKVEVDQLAHEIGMNQPHFLTWDLKHGNHGLLLFEYQEASALDVLKQKFLSSAVALLGFCPIL